jgi:hypothetical protein
MRATKSPELFVQIVGRGLRLSPCKENCLLLDYGRVIENLGDPLYITDSESKKNDLIMCPDCDGYSHSNEICDHCGYKFEAKCIKCDEYFPRVDGHECSVKSKPRDMFKDLTNESFQIGASIEQVTSITINDFVARSGKRMHKVVAKCGYFMEYTAFLFTDKQSYVFRNKIKDIDFGFGDYTLSVKQNGKYKNIDKIFKDGDVFWSF